MKKKPQKRFIVRKYIMARSAQEALKKEPKHIPDEVYIDEHWINNQQNHLESAIGFEMENNYEEE